MRDFQLGHRWQPAGACWHRAAVEAGSCAHVLKDKRRLAHAFTNCHLQDSSRPLAPPPSQMSDATFAIYTEFFTHASDLCFHLQGEHHQQRAHDALAQLTGRAEEWLRAILWMQAVARFLAGAALIWAAARVAQAIDVPRAPQAARVAQVAHAVWHAAASVGGSAAIWVSWVVALAYAARAGAKTRCPA